MPAAIRHGAENVPGPSVGWIMAPLQNFQPVTAAGTYTIDPNTNLIE